MQSVELRVIPSRARRPLPCLLLPNLPLPGAAACSVASLTNPAKMAPGLGGTGGPVVAQPALTLEKGDLQGLVVGDRVRVSGQRVNSGEIRATRVQRVATAVKAFVSGPYAVVGGVGLAVGGTPLTVTDLPPGLREGQEVSVGGDWEDGRLRVREWRIQPTRQALGGARDVQLQGYVHGLRGGELQLGSESLRLDDKVQVVGGNLQSLKVDQSVPVRARVDEQRRLGSPPFDPPGDDQQLWRRCLQRQCLTQWRVGRRRRPG